MIAVTTPSLSAMGMMPQARKKKDDDDEGWFSIIRKWLEGLNLGQPFDAAYHPEGVQQMTTPQFLLGSDPFSNRLNKQFFGGHYPGPNKPWLSNQELRQQYAPAAGGKLADYPSQEAVPSPIPQGILNQNFMSPPQAQPPAPVRSPEIMGGFPQRTSYGLADFLKEIKGVLPGKEESMLSPQMALGMGLMGMGQQMRTPPRYRTDQNPMGTALMQYMLLQQKEAQRPREEALKLLGLYPDFVKAREKTQDYTTWVDEQGQIRSVVPGKQSKQLKGDKEQQIRSLQHGMVDALQRGDRNAFETYFSIADRLKAGGDVPVGVYDEAQGTFEQVGKMPRGGRAFKRTRDPMAGFGGAKGGRMVRVRNPQTGQEMVVTEEEARKMGAIK